MNIKFKFNSDDNLPLNKPLKLNNLTIIGRSVFKEDGKCYLQMFLDECLYELKELIFQKELILIKQIIQKNV